MLHMFEIYMLLPMFVKDYGEYACFLLGDRPTKVLSRCKLTLKVLVATIDALGHFETG